MTAFFATGARKDDNENNVDEPVHQIQSKIAKQQKSPFELQMKSLF